jgi:hypothetical protein
MFVCVCFISEVISTAHSINPSHQSVCLMCIPPIAALQRLCKNVTAAKNAAVTIEVLLDPSFSVPPVLYQRKVGC